MTIFEIESLLRVRLITGEFELIFYLYFNGPTKSSDLSKVTKVSVANFQIILRKMKEAGIFNYTFDRSDGRVRIYDLTDEFRQELEMALNRSDLRNALDALKVTVR